MTDDEIDQALGNVYIIRRANNLHFIEWLRTSFKCPHCREAASRYQSLIRTNDLAICEANEPLTKL